MMLKVSADMLRLEQIPLSRKSSYCGTKTKMKLNRRYRQIMLHQLEMT